ncbi:hypothetical protein FHX81_3675 [Saccharothrix saharensis]|uniref:Uncharacterized protein n=1 Tax=Saccharothrix saharensis TaxID=571190 RepID=A0A543JER3_9PSEU|nr:hypothetical protein FHX81_3675 [Saccharothrix saharensis]
MIAGCFPFGSDRLCVQNALDENGLPVGDLDLKPTSNPSRSPRNLKDQAPAAFPLARA